MAPILTTMSPVETLTPKKAILPPNDPARPEWGLFSDILGVPCAPDPGSTPREAAKKMHSLVNDRILNLKPATDALIMKCVGKQIAGVLKSKPQSYEVVMQTLIQRLHNKRRDGKVTPSKVGKAHSSNMVFLAWEPENGGLVTYLSVNAAKILSRELEQDSATKPGRVSLDAMRDGYNKEPDTQGNFVQRNGNASSSDDEPGDLVEHDDAVVGEVAPETRVQKAGRPEQTDDASEAPKLTDEAEEAVGKEELPAADFESMVEAMETNERVATETRRKFNVNALASAHVEENDPILRGPDHPDYRLLSTAQGLVLSPEPEEMVGERNEQLREMARSAVEITLIEADERLELLDAISHWDPSQTSFARRFWRATDRMSMSLDQIREPHVVDTGTNLQFEFALDYVSAAEELAKQARHLPPQPKGMTDTEWSETLIACRTWFVASARDSEDLVSTSRPDYLALCALNGEKPRRKAAPEEMSEHLKLLYGKWMGNMLTHASEIYGESDGQIEPMKEMHRRMAEWKPLEDGYAGEVVAEKLHTIWEEMKQAAEVEAAAKVAQGGNRELSPRPVPIPKTGEQLVLDATDFTQSADRSLPIPKPVARHQEFLQ